jgi:hypothetical protein
MEVKISVRTAEIPIPRKESRCMDHKPLDTADRKEVEG